MRIKHKVNVRVAEDEDMENILFGPNDNLAEVTIDSRTKTASGTINIAQNTNEDLVFGDVDDVQCIYISVDQDVTLKLNGGNEEILMKKSTDAVVCKFFIEAAITAVNVAAPVDGDVTGVYEVYGD